MDTGTGNLADLAKQGTPVINLGIFSDEEIQSIEARLAFQIVVSFLLFLASLIVIIVDIVTLSIKAGELSIELTPIPRGANLIIMAIGVLLLGIILRVVFPRLYNTLITSKALIKGLHSGEGIVSLDVCVDSMDSYTTIDSERTRNSNFIKTESSHYITISGKSYQIDNKRVYEDLRLIKDKNITLYFIYGEKSLVHLAYLFRAEPTRMAHKQELV